jgi:hypothetical protein
MRVLDGPGETAAPAPEHALLEQFHDAPPALLSERALLARVDRKFILPRTQLPDLLACLASEHRLLRAAKHPAASYETVYFDTPDQRMYHDHRRGRLPRYKVRVRHQLERELTFLEIKRKGHDGRTVKTRAERPFRDTALDQASTELIEASSPFVGRSLRPALWIAFTRATLLSVATEERLTIDWGFALRRGERLATWSHLAIVEIKQRRHAQLTPAVVALRTLGVREARISKFCAGLAMLSAPRPNAFLPTLRDIARISA